jgi:nitrite reductase/ring-hydroxylating ferredoxin subunit
VKALVYDVTMSDGRFVAIATASEVPARGLKFAYKDGPLDEEGILLRLGNGELRAYKNECRHLPMRLDDREPHTFWDTEGKHLYCSSHGAIFKPDDGLCLAGPCRGSHLKQLPIVVENGTVFLDTSRVGLFLEDVSPGETVGR